MEMRGSFVPPARPVRATLVVVLMLVSALVVGCGGGGERAAPPAPEPDTVEVEVYLTNPDLGDPCTEVFPVPRTVDADDLVAGTLQALVTGPTEVEVQQGYGGWFSTDTADVVLDVEVIHGTVHVTFSDLRLVIPNASSSCGASALLAQLDTTLLALDGIDATRYAMADRAAFYGWLQLPDPDAPLPPPSTDPEPEPEPEPDTDEPSGPDDGSATPDLRVARISEVIAVELASAYEPAVDVEVTCDRSGPVQAGDVFVCEARSDQLPDTDWGGIVVAVVGDTTIAWSPGTDNPGSFEGLWQAYDEAPHGLFCRDLLEPDAIGHPFSGVGTVPQTAFFWSLVYWNLEGQPARMDADGDGVPCESLYDTEVIDGVLIEIEP
jgi:hypothetical protein